METQNAFKRVIELMCSSSISVPEIEKQLSAMPAERLFDLAVKDQKGYVRRVPAAKIASVNRNDVIGIYPFKEDECFLELEERHHTVYNIFPWTDIWGGKGNQDIPDEHAFKRINQVLAPLNIALKNIAAKPYNDLYVVRGVGSYKAIATFNWRSDMYYLDWHSPMVRRYMKPQNYLSPYQGKTIEVQPFDIKKEDALSEIVNLMVEYGIALYDIKHGMGLVTPFEATLDLLMVKENGELARVPFAKRESFAKDRIIGLYPFKDEDKALDVNEYLYGTTDGIADAMERSDMDRFNEVLNILNSALEKIEAHPLRGRYFVFRNDICHHFFGEATTKDIAPEDAENFPKNVRYYWDLGKKKYQFIDGKLEYITSIHLKHQ